jgi:hypothetical protein
VEICKGGGAKTADITRIGRNFGFDQGNMHRFILL